MEQHPFFQAIQSKANEELCTLLNVGYSRDDGVRNIGEQGIQFLRTHSGYIETLLILEQAILERDKHVKGKDALERYALAEELYEKVIGHKPLKKD